MLFIILGTIFSFLSLTPSGIIVYLAFLLESIFLKIYKKGFCQLPVIFLFTPFVSFFDITLLPIMLGTLLCIEKERVKEIKIFPYFTLFLLCAYCIQFFYIFEDIPFLFKNYGIEDLYSFFNYNNLFYRNLFYIFLYHFSFLDFLILSRDRVLCQNSLKFLKVGAIFCIVFFLMHLFLPTKFFMGMNSYWASLNRYSGGFSDPNSAGLSLFLMIPFLIYYSKVESQKNKICTIIICLLLLIVGFFTGSRSFILGLSLVFLFLILNGKRIFIVTFLSSLLFFVATNIFFYIYGMESLNFLPSTLLRVFKGLYIGELQNTFGSRFYFTIISFYVFKDNIFTGVGFNNFYSYFPYFSNLLGFNTGSWQDSTCNFYLGVLAEGGIIALLFLVLSFGGIRVKKEKNRLMFLTFLSFLVILCFVSFLSIEFIILSALLFALLFDFKIKKASFGFYAFLVASLCFYNILFFYKNLSFYGLYNLENENGKIAVWTFKKSSFPLKCLDNKATLNFSVPRLNINDYPISLSYATNFGQSRNMEISDGKMQEIILNCNNKDVVNVSMDVNNLWLPRELDDKRFLGVRVYLENILDMPLKGNHK